VGAWLRITQEELRYLVGMSRQRVNQALSRLGGEGLIRAEYGGLRVLDLAGLRRFPQADQAANATGSGSQRGIDAQRSAVNS
jgi:CRP/FNR family transcriptional regulator, cyclic AMP receptor protein